MATRKRNGSKGKKEVFSTKPLCALDIADQLELKPGARRTRGKQLKKLIDAASETSFCSEDVIQAYPEVLDYPCDQQHFVTEWRSVVRMEEPYQVQLTASKVAAMPGVCVFKRDKWTHVYKFKEEKVTIPLATGDCVVYNRKGNVVGVNGNQSQKGITKAKKNVELFKTFSSFNQSRYPSEPGDLDPEVGGELVAISCSGRIGTAVDGKGNSWRFRMKNKFRILVECFPNVKAPERIFLIYAWRWNTVNNVGVMYNSRLLSRKQISINFGKKSYMLEASPTLPIANQMFRLFGSNSFGMSHLDVLSMELRARFGEADFGNEDVIDHIRDYYRRNKDLQEGIKEIVMNLNIHDGKASLLKYMIKDE